jgi:hypothetical protein
MRTNQFQWRARCPNTPMSIMMLLHVCRFLRNQRSLPRAIEMRKPRPMKI